MLWARVAARVDRKLLCIMQDKFGVVLEKHEFRLLPEIETESDQIYVDEAKLILLL